MLQKIKNQRTSRVSNHRGFLLLVVVGILAVLLTMCVGFLSYTRAELGAVSHIRDKADTYDIADTATDYILANIADQVIDPASQQFITNGSNGAGGTGGYVSKSLGADGHWWYRPLENGINSSPQWGGPVPGNQSWKANFTVYQDGGDWVAYEAPWVNLPADYFPGGGVRGRFSVMVADANSRININNWGENCMPSQCQMAHMMMDAGGPQYTETLRAAYLGRYPSGNSSNPFMDFGWGDQIGWEPEQLERYKDCFNIATRSLYTPTLMTTNSTSFQAATLFSTTFGPKNRAEAAPGSSLPWFWEPVLNSCYWQSYIDPDTGRSPVNVNTVENEFRSAYNQWGHIYFPNTLQAVFNVESLRRIIKVGKFYFRNNTSPGVRIPDPNDPSGSPKFDQAQIDAAYSEMDVANLYDNNFIANDPTFNANFDPKPNITITTLLDPHKIWTTELKTKQDVANAMRLFVEMLKTRLAFQYQQTMCRYFQATYPIQPYCHSLYYPEVPFNWADRIWDWPKPQNMNYYTTYSMPNGPMNSGEAQQVKYAAKNYDDTTTRFPVGIVEFRDQVKKDLIAMTANNNIAADPGWQGDAYLGNAHDGGETVCFGRPVLRNQVWYQNYYYGLTTDNGIPEILPGKLDRRTASAIYDNIIPGKAYLFPGDPNIEIKDPLGQLYAAGWGRDENQTNEYNYFGLVPFEPGNWFVPPPPGTPGSSDVGRDINTATNGGPVPQRQLTFGPDWFSTELTTASTTYVLIVNAQLLDAESLKANPTNPTILFHHQRQVVVEIAPDIAVEDKGGDFTKDGAGDGTPNGLHYYRDGMPQKRKTDPLVMDLNCNTLPTDYRYDSSLKIPIASTDTTKAPTSVPRDWIDYRGVAPADAKNYYKAGPQTTNRVVIRSFWSLNNP
jgi:hypothetical protein